MMLQTGRYLISCYKDALNGIKQPDGVSYLNNLEQSKQRKSVAKNSEEIVKLDG